MDDEIATRQLFACYDPARRVRIIDPVLNTLNNRGCGEAFYFLDVFARDLNIDLFLKMRGFLRRLVGGETTRRVRAA